MRGSKKKLKTTALYDNLLRNGVQQSSRIKVLRATRQPGKIDSFVCVCTLEYKINSALGTHATRNARVRERMREEG